MLLLEVLLVRRVYCAAILSLSLYATVEFAQAADPTVSIEPRENWSAVFGDTELRFRFAIKSTTKLEGMAAWSLSAKQRTISQGTAPLKIAANGEAVITASVNVPPVKAGVVVDARIDVRVLENEARKPIAEFSKPVWIYPEDPFYLRKTWLEALTISLFDPENQTAKIFDKAEIPYKLVRSTSALQTLTKGVLIIGEGISLEDYRGLAEELMKTAARGVPVLCLPIRDGSIPWPEPDGKTPRPEGIQFGRSNVIAKMDKRLDAKGWPPEGDLIASRLMLVSDRRGILMEHSDEASAWPWVEVEYPRNGATLILCGFGITRQWNDGPTPRFLLARILERLDSRKEEPEAE